MSKPAIISALRPPSTRPYLLRHRTKNPATNANNQPTTPTPSATHQQEQEDQEQQEDAHSIIAPSKHTPKIFQKITGSLSSTGPLLHPFRLLRQDLQNLRQRYISDWTTFNQQIVASAVFVFFTNLLPGITFASDFLSTQPLTILGVTGPFTVLAENISSLCTTTFHIPFLPFMAWTLLHSTYLHYLLAILNAHDWTMRYATTFTTEIFSLLNSIIYFHKAIQELQRVKEGLSFAAFLYAVLGASFTTLVAIFLSTAESWRPLFPRVVRTALAEYAAAISIVVFILVPHTNPDLKALDTLSLPVSTSFTPTSPERTTFIVEFWTLPLRWVFAAMIPAVIITILFFFDHEVSSIICTIDRYNTRKPAGFAWDVVLLGTTTGLCGILGIPPANGLLPQAPLHSESLMHVPKPTSSSPPSSPESSQPQPQQPRVHEQRYSPLLASILILLFLTPPLMHLLGLTPTSVLAGLFLFMGQQSLSTNPILYRFFYLLTPPSSLPPLPPGVSSYWPVHGYTLLQILVTGGVFGVTLTRAAPIFPVLVVALVPVRLVGMRRVWGKGSLRFLDAWACRGGRPEDEDEVEEGDGLGDGVVVGDGGEVEMGVFVGEGGNGGRSGGGV
ncbi:MAG: hypothetical protein M1834_007988 [Cirrosporium novae-zelandiae]|nr:MAG: hypothetical protein M1834_007988 [Cirrosporium novae-zelandiae]